MAEHLLQQTLPPEMAVMAEYYEQGVTPQTQAEAALSLCARFARNGHELANAELDGMINIEALQIGESARGSDGGAIGDAELKRLAAAAFTAAALIDRETALGPLARLNVPFERARSTRRSRGRRLTAT